MLGRSVPQGTPPQPHSAPLSLGMLALATFILFIALVASRKRTRRLTSAAITKKHLEKVFLEHHSSTPVSPASVCEWITSLHDSAPRRTKGINCRSANCSDPSCCVRQLASSTLGTYMRLLKTTATGKLHHAALKSDAVTSLLKELKDYQTERGRHQTPGAPVFKDTAEEILLAAEVHIAELLAEGRLLEALTARQAACAIAFDLWLWRRCGDLLELRWDRVTLSTDSSGLRRIHLELLHQKVMSCGNGRCATTVERPGDPTCALHQLDLLLAFMASNELDIQPGTKLFAQFHMVEGNCVIRLTRTEHKRTCQHSFPADLQPDCDENCFQWSFPSVSTTTVNNMLRTFCTLASVSTEYRVHGLRSAPVLVMLANGTRVSNINVLMGWSDKSSMWKLYARQAQFASVQLARVIDPAEIQRTIDAAASSKPIEPW